MFSFRVGNKEYKIKYGYGVLCETDLIDRVIDLSNTEDGENTFQKIMSTVAELLLAGLQKKHSDEFGYETEFEKKAALEKVYDIMDEYEDESTKECPQDVFTLFEKLQDELMSNGFLSRITAEAQKMAQAQDATKIPQDHRRKRN